MWSRKLIKNKIYAILIVLIGALSVPIEWDATFFFIFPDYGSTAVLCENELDL